MTTNENSNRNNHLQELGDSDFKIVEGQPNIKGWDVKDGQGKYIGEVEELLFDPASRQVRYIVLDLEGNLLDLDAREVLVPIGLAELHESDDDVILPNVTQAQLEALPEYDDDYFTPDMEGTIQQVFAGAGVAGAAAYDQEHNNADNLYRRRGNLGSNAVQTIPVIEEDLQVGKREVESGGATIHTKIEETPVEEIVKLRSEHVKVEPTSVDRPANEADFNQRESTIELMERMETPVISKEARVVEEINLDKTVEEREETIRDTVRKTEVDVEKFDSDDEHKDFPKRTD